MPARPSLIARRGWRRTSYHRWFASVAGGCEENFWKEKEKEKREAIESLGPRGLGLRKQFVDRSDATEKASRVERIAGIELMLDGFHEGQRIAGRTPGVE
jgi:hypothetical protein